MKLSVRLAACLFCVCGTSAVIAGGAADLQDPRAVEVLNKMAAYTSSLDKFVLTGEVHGDARLDAGLIVSNPAEITVKIDRPGSLHASNFDGVNTKNIYLNDGSLTVFGTERNFYAHASVPKDIEEGMSFALEELEVEAPLAELFFAKRTLETLLGETEVIYLTDKSRIRGVDCHHIAVRGPDVDVQLWVEEGSQPVPRKMLMTMKWEGGSPRYSAIPDWKPVDSFDSATFEFKPPEGAMEIQFVGSGQ